MLAELSDILIDFFADSDPGSRSSGRRSQRKLRPSASTKLHNAQSYPDQLIKRRSSNSSGQHDPHTHGTESYDTAAPGNLPAVADPKTRMYIASAMQQIAAYFMSSPQVPPPWLSSPLYPVPPSGYTEEENEHWSTYTSNLLPGNPGFRTSTKFNSSPRPYETPPGQSSDILSSSSSMERLARLPKALVRRSKSRGRRVSFSLIDDIIGKGGYEEELLHETSGDDTVGRSLDTRRPALTGTADLEKRGRGYRRAQTPGPSSRQVPPPSATSRRSKSLPRR